MRLFLIRHAQSANNALPEEQRIEDPPITALGHRQAAALAGWIERCRLEHLITSPFRRSLETTEHLRRRLNLVPHVWIDLHEQGGCYAGYAPGKLQGRPGMTRQQIAQQYPEYVIEPDIADAGWWACRPYESAAAAQDRARRLLLRTISAFRPQAARVGLVMHADFKRLFLTEAFSNGARCDRSWDGIYNTAVTTIDLSDSRPQLEVFNSIAHLTDDLVSS